MKWSEAQEVVLKSEGNTIVSASAGSGKTTVMIEKVMQYLREGKDLERILIMTFTREAAHDMKQKLVSKIYKEIAPDGKGTFLRKQLEKIPFSNICTINSFCYTLLKKYFSVVKQDPSCTMLDEKESVLLQQECLDKIIEKELEEGKTDFKNTLSFFSKNRNLDGFRQQVMALWNFIAVQEEPDRFISAYDNSAAVEEYYLTAVRKEIPELISQAERALQQLKDEECSDFDESFGEMVIRLNAALEAKDIKEFFTEAGFIDFPKNKLRRDLVTRGVLSQPTFDACFVAKEEITDYAENAKSMKDLYENETKQEQYAEIVQVLLRVYRATSEEYALRKKMRLAVDFNDTERAAVTILKEESLREEIRKSFDYIFVDEYQDTNYLQEAILEGISDGNNLFSVGDIKQAIYRFRYAEPTIFKRRMDFYEAEKSGVSCLLNGNYRSCREVLDFTNDVCSEVITQDFGEVDYKNTAMLSCETDSTGGEVALYTYTEPKEEYIIPQGEVYRVKTAPKVNKIDKEAAFIAEEIARCIQTLSIATEETETVEINGEKVEQKRTVYRPADYKDFAILLRGNNKFEAVTEALKKKNIPYYSNRKKEKSVFPQREAVVDCLRILLNDSEDISLVHIMTEIFDFSNAELVAIKKAFPDGPFSTAVQKSTDEKVAKMREKISLWREYAGFMSVDMLLDEMLDSGYDAKLLACGKEVVANMNAFILFVRSQAEGMSVREFLRYYDEAYQGNTTPAPSSAVTVMTLHGSKGLEFPVVFMPYLNGKFNLEFSSIICDRELGVAVPQFNEEDLTKSENFTLAVLKMKKTVEAKEDEARLMYVGFTRAKLRLILTGKETKACKHAQDAKSVMEWLMYTSDRNAAFDKKYRKEMPELKVQTKEEDTVLPKRFDFGRLCKKYRYEKAVAGYAKTSVSGILEEENRSKVYRKEDRLADENAKRGTAMHEVLRYIDFNADTEEKVKTEIIRLQNEGFLGEETAKYCDPAVIARVLSSPEMEQAKRYKTEREYPFVAYMCPNSDSCDKVLVQGIIDLLVYLPDGNVQLIDYKVSTLGAEKLKESYSKQLDIYTRAVESILGKQVADKFLYNILRGYCVHF